MKFDNNCKRLALSAILGALLLTAIFILLPKNHLVIAGYSFGLAGIIELGISLLLVAQASDRNYITRLSFPPAVWNYLCTQLVVTTIVLVLDGLSFSMPLAWFCLLHICLLTYFAWKMLAMATGQDEIEKAEQNITMATATWKMLQADAESLREETPAEFHRHVAAVCDAFRYADPVSNVALEEYDDRIAVELNKLTELISAGNRAAIEQQCALLQRKIKDRNYRAKMFK